MERIVLEAKGRTSLGKGANRRLRAQGMIPAVVYGERKDPISVAVDPKELIRILRSHAGVNTIFELQIKGSRSKDNVIIKDYQLEPVNHQLLHADLMRVAMDHALTVTVPVELAGQAAGVKQQGGLLDFVSRSVEVSCLPADIPEAIVAQVTDLQIGELIRAGDLLLPERVALVSDPEVVIAHVLAPRVEAAEEAEAAPTEEEAEEPEVIKKGKAEEEKGSKE
ncbi:MAG: 50S ribosomal protein L25/general stress protein Ctc [Acidobacteriota bacterium]